MRRAHLAFVHGGARTGLGGVRGLAGLVLAIVGATRPLFRALAALLAEPGGQAAQGPQGGFQLLVIDICGARGPARFHRARPAVGVAHGKGRVARTGCRRGERPGRRAPGACGSTGHAHLEIRVIGEAAGMGAHRRRLARTTIRRNASRCVEGNDIRLSWHGSSLVLSLPGFVSGAGSQSRAGRLSVRRRGAPCSQVEACQMEHAISDASFEKWGAFVRSLDL